MTLPSFCAQQQATILIVDDHPIFREGLAQIINRQPDMAVCQEASDVAGATGAVEASTPHLVVLDLHLGAGDVFELIKSWRARFPNVWVLILSHHDESLYAERALRAGASGYVMKEEAAEHVLRAIRTVLAGEMYVSPKMAAKLLHKLIQAKPAGSDAGLETLSDRELHVFRLVGLGLSTRKMAEELHLSLKTIETHREHIKHKLGLPTATELVRHATQWIESSVAPVPVPPPPG